jgi:hypothetical protein
MGVHISSAATAQKAMPWLVARAPSEPLTRLLQFGRDGTMAQSVVPDYDYRIPYAMETHGVRSSLLRPVPEVQTTLGWCMTHSLPRLLLLCRSIHAHAWLTMHTTNQSWPCAVFAG